MRIEFFFLTHTRGQLVLFTVHVWSEDVGLCSDVMRAHHHKHSAVGKHRSVKHTFTHCSSQCASMPKINSHGFDLMEESQMLNFDHGGFQSTLNANTVVKR